jgi:voltage-gated potassium channel
MNLNSDLHVETLSNNEIILDRPIFSWPIAILIIYSVICYSAETLPELSDGTIRFLYYSELIVVAIFTIEYLYRIYAAPKKRHFILSYYGLIDLLAIIPFYLATAVDLRTLRLLRLLRIARLLKLARYNAAIQRFTRALYIVKEELIIFSFSSIVIIYLAAVGIYHFENNAQPEVFRSIFDCLWWAVITLTTVGYGDIYPITIGGRVFTFVVLMVGLGMIAVPTGIVASALSEVRIKQQSTVNKENNLDDERPSNN